MTCFLISIQYRNCQVILTKPHHGFSLTSSPAHEDRAWHVAWNPTKPLLASCSADKSVRMYNYTSPRDGSELRFSHVATIPTGHTKTVRSVAWAPSGETLATASFDSNIGIWEQAEADEGEAPGSGEWECASLLEGHETECKSVAYSSTGTLLASCSRDKTVWIWEGRSVCAFLLYLTMSPIKFTPTRISNAWVSSWNIVKT